MYVAICLRFNFPNFGTIKANDLYYFGNSNSTSMSGPVNAVTVLRTALDSNADLVQPDMQDFLNKNRAAIEAAEKKFSEKN